MGLSTSSWGQKFDSKFSTSLWSRHNDAEKQGKERLGAQTSSEKISENTEFEATETSVGDSSNAD
jgi:hypothetical protein